MIVPRDNVRKAVERAMLLDTSGSIDLQEKACQAVAQALALPVETVRECMEQQEQPA